MTEFIKESVIEGIEVLDFLISFIKFNSNKYKQITVLLSVVYKSADVASCIFPRPGMD